MLPVRSIGKFIGASTATKPTASVQPGSTFYEDDTAIWYIFNGTAWVPRPWLPFQSVNRKQVSLNQVASAYDVMTATTQNLFIDAVVVHVPQNLSAVATFTGISVQTDDDTPLVILSSTDGAKAKLTGDFYHLYRGPVVSVSTKKIQLSIIGATAGAGSVANLMVFWRPVVAGGYYLNA